MKVALCFFGIVGGNKGKNGKGGYIDYELCAEHYKKHIINNNDVDVFMHTWSHELEKELTEIYEPKDAIFQEQIDFDVSKMKPKDRDKYWRASSRWYSNKQVLDLVRKKENESGEKYDIVMVTRFDTMFFKDINFEDYDPSNFYAANWNADVIKGKYWVSKTENLSVTRGKRLADLWFFSNSDYMNKFSELYDSMDKYHISPHKGSWEYLMTFMKISDIKYVLWRHFDYELYRWSVLKEHHLK